MYCIAVLIINMASIYYQQHITLAMFVYIMYVVSQYLISYYYWWWQQQQQQQKYVYCHYCVYYQQYYYVYCYQYYRYSEDQLDYQPHVHQGLGAVRRGSQVGNLKINCQNPFTTKKISFFVKKQNFIIINLLNNENLFFLTKSDMFFVVRGFEY